MILSAKKISARKSPRTQSSSPTAATAAFFAWGSRKSRLHRRPFIFIGSVFSVWHLRLQILASIRGSLAGSRSTNPASRAPPNAEKMQRPKKDLLAKESAGGITLHLRTRPPRATAIAPSPFTAPNRSLRNEKRSARGAGKSSGVILNGAARRTQISLELLRLSVIKAIMPSLHLVERKYRQSPDSTHARHLGHAQKVYLGAVSTAKPKSTMGNSLQPGNQ